MFVTVCLRGGEVNATGIQCIDARNAVASKSAWDTCTTANYLAENVNIVEVENL